jgi:fibronectin type 3 domain-containing protein
MENIITIGGKVDKETADNLKDYMVAIFKAGKESGMDQSTIVEAIHAVSKVATTDHATITHSSFIGEKHIHIEDEKV